MHALLDGQTEQNRGRAFHGRERGSREGQLVDAGGEVQKRVAAVGTGGRDPRALHAWRRRRHRDARDRQTLRVGHRAANGAVLDTLRLGSSHNAPEYNGKHCRPGPRRASHCGVPLRRNRPDLGHVSGYIVRGVSLYRRRPLHAV